MINCLWLCSWYPNEVDKFRGDFVQRHALAASLYCKINVVHVVFCNYDKTTVQKVNDNLTEHIFYVKKKNKFIDYTIFYFIHQKIRRQIKADLIHVHVAMNAGIIAMIWKLFYKIPYIITEHYGIYNQVVKNNFSTRSFIYKKACQLIFKNAEKLLSVSSFIANSINKTVGKIPYEIVHNSVDTSLFYLLKKNTNEVFKFVHVSNLSENKNILGILAAFEQLIKTNFLVELNVIGGKKNEIEELKIKFPHLLNNINFFGELNYELVAQNVQSSDCLLMNSFMENSPCVIVEALCCGVPVIATNVGGIPELITAQNGLLVEPNNTNDLILKMKTMIENKHIFEHEIISQNAISKFGYASIGKHINSHYQKLVHQ